MNIGGRILGLDASFTFFLARSDSISRATPAMGSLTAMEHASFIAEGQCGLLGLDVCFFNRTSANQFITAPAPLVRECIWCTRTRGATGAPDAIEYF